MSEPTDQLDSDACVLRVDGDFDSECVPRVREALDAALEAGRSSIVLDLSGVDYLDSSALGFIVWADRRLRPVLGTLSLAGANPDVARILEVAGLVGMAPTVSIAPSIEEALAAGADTGPQDEPLWSESFEFPAEVSRMSAARNRVAEILAPLGLADSAVFDIKVAVGEALANAVRHGSPRGSEDVVSVEVRAFPARVDVVVSDRGCGYDGVARVSHDTFAPGGRGVLFMRALMDVVLFGPAACGGTNVTLGKRRAATA